MILGIETPIKTFLSLIIYARFPYSFCGLVSIANLFLTLLSTKSGLFLKIAPFVSKTIIFLNP